ncbi:ubiquinol-cytochrome c reductase iron-sulfur subunit [Fimbriimonas ginsengisoli]|uniref:Rieske (2Fe-2S) domain-containing protein n=1 Tax=Fimbriimonas ginsengisoli Gsoil 348 TaxID=661478 RepID=A0A068NTD6_FIMGI|nr:Rieske (2Fe-2S) protein [Fimbriimonas ginsengisoli]AIE86582.1 Rieske (2Fe-2S) domain-containing protein [Fimbriimonas ginsengisoli Gsoil 348]
MERKLNEDFPIDWDEDHYVSRREFFKFMTLASGGLAVGSIGLAAWSVMPRDHRKMDAKEIGELATLPVGGSMAFNYPREHDLCILVQPQPGVFKAYSRRCTHLSCPVEWEPEKNRLYCPCHNGAFSISDGKVLQGPPPRPLPEIMLEVRDGRLFAVGVKRGDA